MNKIAIFKYATAFGGGEKYTQLLCNGLSQQRKSSRATSNDNYCSNDRENYSVALTSNYIKLINGCHADKKIYCRRLPEAKTRREILTLIILWPVETINYLTIALRLRLKGYRVIILQDLNEKLLLTPICRLFGIKVFWVEHTNWQPHLVKHPFFPILQLSMRLTEKIICPSQQLAKQINDATVVTASSNGVISNDSEKSHEISRPETAEQARDDARHTRYGNKIIVISHGVPKTIARDRHQSTRIVTTTRLSPEKGVDLLIGAVAQLDSNPEVIVFGDGPQKKELVALVGRLGIDAVFKGHVDDPYAIISESDIFILPSRIENFPLSILEALSAGIVIVAPNIGGVPEILKGNGNFLFNAGDIDDLRDKICTALKLSDIQRQKLSSSNKKLWQTRYNSTVMVEKTISVMSKSFS